MILMAIALHDLFWFHAEHNKSKRFAFLLDKGPKLIALNLMNKGTAMNRYSRTISSSECGDGMAYY